MSAIGWIFAVITLSAAATATAVENMRRATLALWITGLGMGGIYLTLGAETLAIVQWILSTLAAISFVFFAVMFGEYSAPDKASERKRLLISALGMILGLVFATIIYKGGGILSDSLLLIPKEGNNLSALGRNLTQNHLLSLEVLALTLFLVLVGGGVIARPDSDSGPELGSKPKGTN